MKTVFLSLMAMSLIMGNANAKDSLVANRKVVAEAAVPAKSSYERLLEENRNLREKIELLTNETAELQSTVAYNAMMSNMFSRLHQDQAADKMADLQSELHYDAMMQTMFTRLRAEEKADAAADQLSLDQYNHMMGNMFRQLDSRKAAEALADAEAVAQYENMMALMFQKLRSQKS